MFGSGTKKRYAAQIAQRTGLQQQGDRFAGTFQGFTAWTRTGMAANVGALAVGSGGGLLGGLGALLGGSAGGMAHGMTGGDFMMKHDYVIELPGWNLPGASLRETTSWAVNKGIQQRRAVGQKTSSGVPWIDSKYEVCANDPGFIQFICAWPELQQWLQHWPYLNLCWEPQRVWLELLDSVIRINSKFGTAAQQNGDMVFQGMSVVAAATRACYNR